MNIFRIKCKKITCDYTNLWNANVVKSYIGTAFPITVNNHRVLVTACHIINECEDIGISANGKRNKFIPSRIFYCHEADLAILDMEPKFWEKYPDTVDIFSDAVDWLTYDTIKAGTIISVIGYTDGDISSSMTTGIISKLCCKKVNDLMTHLVGQIDAKSHKGFSGGIVLCKSNKIYGMLLGDNNFSYMLPIFTMQRYIKSYKQKGIDKWLPTTCELGIQTKPKIIDKIQLPEITLVSFTGCCYNKLFKGDVIFSIDGREISQYNLIKEDIPYWQVVRDKYPKDIITIKVMRDDNIAEVSITLGGSPKMLLPRRSDYINKKYYIFAGLDFMTLNVNYFESLRKKYQPDDTETFTLFSKYQSDFTYGETQIIILKSIFQSSLYGPGFSDYQNLMLTHINGHRITNIKNVYDICENLTDAKMITFKLKRINAINSETIELDHAKALELSPIISQKVIGKHYHNF